MSRPCSPLRLAPLGLLIGVALALNACAAVGGAAAKRHESEGPAAERLRLHERLANTITVGVIAGGTDHETPYWIRSSGADGPTVLIVGGVHGNEPAGAFAADEIRHWTITRGTLVVVPRANPPALRAGTRRTPGAPRTLSDLNRNFPSARPVIDDDGVRDESMDAPRGAIAKSLWTFVVDIHPDWLLDLHEGFAVHRIDPESVGSSIIHTGEPWIEAHVARMLDAVNVEIDDPERHFTSLGRPEGIGTSLTRAATAHLGTVGLTLETTWRDQPIELRTRQHLRMVHQLLSDLGMVGPTRRPAIAPRRSRAGNRSHFGHRPYATWGARMV